MPPAAPASGPSVSCWSLLRRLLSRADGRDDQVAERLGIVRVDGLGIDRSR